MHAYNMGLATSMKGGAVEAVRVTFGASGAPTLVDKGKSNLVLSVAKTATGRYTFTLNKPYPAYLVALEPSLSAATTTGAFKFARYLEASYSATAGTFEVDICDTVGTPALVDPTSGTALDLVLVFQRYKN